MEPTALCFNLPTLESTKALGQALAQTLPVGTVLLLRGDLGSGKTTLVQALGAALGIEEAIVSPTFTLVVEYGEGRLPLYHFDLYRLPPEAGDQWQRLGLAGYWEGEVEPGIVAIEWSEYLPITPPQALVIELCLLPQGDRQVSLKTSDPVLAPLLGTIAAAWQAPHPLALSPTRGEGE